MRIAIVSKIVQNVFFAGALPGGKFDPSFAQPGGGAVVSAPVLRKLGCDVDMFGPVGRYADEIPFKNSSRDLGIAWHMQESAQPAAVNAVDPGPPLRIFRVVPAPACEFSRDEAQYVQHKRPDALCITGSHSNEYVGSWIEVAAATNTPVLWNAAGSADLGLAALGATVHLQVSFEEFGDGTTTSHELALRLLARTAAQTVIVTDGPSGAVGVSRNDRRPLCAPAIRIAQPTQLVGAGDAHFAGFAAAFMQSAPVARLERGLALARLTAARRLCGMAAGDWAETRAFEQSLEELPAIRPAA